MLRKINNFMIAGFLLLTLGTYSKEKDDFFEGKTKIPDPFGLRDPFSVPQQKLKIDNDIRDGLETPGAPVNIESALRSVNPSQLVVVGVLIGKDRRAVVRSAKGASDSFVLKEGMIIGKDRAELRAILPGGIVLVEKIKNVYNEDEYIETIVPLTE